MKKIKLITLILLIIMTFCLTACEFDLDEEQEELTYGLNKPQKCGAFEITMIDYKIYDWSICVDDIKAKGNWLVITLNVKNIKNKEDVISREHFSVKNANDQKYETFRFSKYSKYYWKSILISSGMSETFTLYFDIIFTEKIELCYEDPIIFNNGKKYIFNLEFEEGANEV